MSAPLSPQNTTLSYHHFLLRCSRTLPELQPGESFVLCKSARWPPCLNPSVAFLCSYDNLPAAHWGPQAPGRVSSCPAVQTCHTPAPRAQGKSVSPPDTASHSHLSRSPSQQHLCRRTPATWDALLCSALLCLWSTWREDLARQGSSNVKGCPPTEDAEVQGGPLFDTGLTVEPAIHYENDCRFISVWIPKQRGRGYSSVGTRAAVLATVTSPGSGPGTRQARTDTRPVSETRKGD